jgi:transposase
MIRYIGMDAHSSSCTFAVVSQKGRKLSSTLVETNGKSLIGFLKTVPGEKHLILEDGTMAQWLFEILRPHVKQLVVVGVTCNSIVTVVSLELPTEILVLLD